MGGNAFSQTMGHFLLENQSWRLWSGLIAGEGSPTDSPDPLEKWSPREMLSPKFSRWTPTQKV